MTKACVAYVCLSHFGHCPPRESLRSPASPLIPAVGLLGELVRPGLKSTEGDQAPTRHSEMPIVGGYQKKNNFLFHVALGFLFVSSLIDQLFMEPIHVLDSSGPLQGSNTFFQDKRVCETSRRVPETTHAVPNGLQVCDARKSWSAKDRIRHLSPKRRCFNVTKEAIC